MGRQHGGFTRLASAMAALALSWIMTPEAVAADGEAALARAEVARAAGDLAGEAEALDAAAAAFAAEAAAATAAGDDAALARAQARLGFAAARAGRAAEAIAAFAGAREAASRAGDRAAAARALLNSGFVAYSQSADQLTAIDRLSRNQLKRAAAFFAEAATEASAAGDRALEARARVYAARTLAELDPPALEAAMRAARGLFDPGADPELALALGQAALERPGASGGAVALAASLFRAATASADARLASLAHERLAAVALAAGDADGALAEGRAALARAEESDSDDARFRALAVIARAHRAAGRRDAEFQALVAARAAVERIRSTLPQFDPLSGRSLYRAAVGPIYLGIAEFHITQGRSTGDAAQFSAAIEALEAMKRIEITQFFGDSCLSVVAAGRPLTEVLGGAVGVYPVVLPGGIEILVIGDGGRISAARSTAPSEEALRAEIARLREALSRGNDINATFEAGTNLYDWLIRPVEAELASAAQDQTLVFVPDGALRLLPWAALFDSRTETFLIERFAIANVLGIEMAGGGGFAFGSKQVVASALTELTVDQQTGEAFQGLRGAGQEVEGLKAVAGGRVREAALTADGLKTAAQATNAQIMHIGSHAVFRTNLEDSFVVAEDGSRIGLDDLRAISAAAGRDGSGIELLVLSACESAVGNDRAALGLAGVALAAGTRSAVASLWRVNDNSTAALTEAFYRGLAQGLTKAKALQAAQNAVRQTLGWEDPYHWAAFTVIGDWR